MKRLIKFIIPKIPSKDYCFAITFHNFSNSDYLWLEKTLDNLSFDYEFIDPNKLQEYMNKKNSKKKILLTFDDGFKTNRYVAENILKPRGIKAIFLGMGAILSSKE